MTAEHFDDPVAAYDSLSAHYADLSYRRELYLRAVEREIVSRIPHGSRSLLDVGAGDGARARRIAADLGIDRLVLLEPSKQMAGESVDCAELWPVRAEDLAEPCRQNAGTEERFAVITCLWNVLGHIPSPEKRQLALGALARLLVPNGRFFLDVNHRYNLRSYGILPTTARWIRDLLLPGETNGDAIARWTAGESTLSTYGHLFTHREIIRLAKAAGFELEERLVIHYDDGRIRRFAFQGNLLYIFRRNSRIDSSSAPQIS